MMLRLSFILLSFVLLCVLMLCANMVAANKIFMVSMLEKDIYTTTIELNANETAEVWFKRFFPNIWKRTVVVKSLTNNATFDICSYYDQPPTLVKDCFNNTSYYEQRLYPYYSLVIKTGPTEISLEVDTYPSFTSPHVTPLIIGIICFVVVAGCLVCYGILMCCLKLRRANYANIDRIRLFV
ncbi:Hypothetical protein HVR_LOCUS479 [uncultured virus]|nr:Hypothetical protein HVR_LOCUS479 [uncultured virus]